MKRIKLCALVALLLCFVMILSSCTFWDMRHLKLGKIYNEGYTDETPALLHAATVDIEGDVIERNGCLFYLRTTGTYPVHTVYNIATDQKVFTSTDTMTLAVTAVRLYTVGLSVVFEAVKTDTTDALNPVVTTELYAVDGTLLDQTRGDVALIVGADLMQLDSKCFCVDENGAATVLFTNSGLTSPLAALGINEAAGDYYHAVSADSVTVYNGKDGMKPTANWKAPSYVAAADLSFFVLNGGNVLIQYTTDAAEDAKLYTYLEGGVKKNVTTLLLKAKNGKVSKLSDDFVFGVVAHRDAKNEVGRDLRAEFTEKTTNVALAVKVERQRLDTSAAGFDTYLLSDGGRVRGTLSATLTGQNYDVAEKVTDDRFVVELQNGQRMLVTTRGEVLSEITGAAAATPAFIVTEEKIYNYQMNAVYDLKTNEMEVVRAYDGSLLLKKTDADEWHLMAANDQVTYLAGSTNQKRLQSAAADRYFILRNDTDLLHPQYEYYNEAGALLFTTSLSTLTQKGGDRENLLLGGFDADAGKNVYYRLTAK